MSPDQFPRRTLLAVTGMSPQIVTETLFALVLSQRFVPTEVRIITTEHGKNRLVRDLLDEVVGQFHAFCRDYDLQEKIQFDISCIDVICDADGNPLPDIRTPDENNHAANDIMRIVQDLCQDPMRALHVSIAGGRKSMGFFLGYALSLFARPQDQASHVLVSEPFENNRDFFYPPPVSRTLIRADGSTLDAASAKVMLADIPIVKLRDGLPHELQVGKISYSVAVSTAQSAIVPTISLAFDLPKRRLLVGAQSIKLAPILIAFMLWMARLKVTARNYALRDEHAADEFLIAYADVVGSRSARYANTHEKIRVDFQDRAQEFASRIKKELTQAMGNRAEPYLVISIGKRNATYYELSLPEACITLPNLIC